MKVIYEDSVDWEPLQMRFLLEGTPTSRRCEAVAAFIVEWMQQREEADPQKWRPCEYSAVVKPSGTVEAYCELMPADEVQPLADAVGKAFPFTKELQLGHAESGSPSLARIDWFNVPAGRVVIDEEAFEVAAFTISFTAVTVGQFCEFMDTCNYVPVPDTLEYPGYVIEHFKLNYGRSPKIPFFGLTYDDAQAFCEWGGFRLPSDPELRLFFETAFVGLRRKFNWSGETWTSTPAGEDMFFVRNGPCRELPPDQHDDCRKPLHRHHYQLLEAPTFRVVRT